LYVGFAAGGAADAAARLIAKKLTENIGQNVVVENKAGAGGNIVHQQVANGVADGSVILLGSIGPMTIAPHMMKVGYEPFKDLAPISGGVNFPNMLVVNKESGIKNLADFVALAKKAPDTVSFASTGAGSASHLTGELFAIRTNTDMLHVPYKGGAQAITDLIGGQVDVMFNGMVATYPHVKAGKIKLIAISGVKRNAQMPDTPTVAESLPGFLTGSFQGLLAPAGTPKAIIDKMHAEVQRIAAIPDVRERLTTLGAEPSGMSPAEFGNWLKAEIPAMAKIVKDEKITVE
jgi:tripartite-type tricarboxylate transporter receptor subunit TctC